METKGKHLNNTVVDRDWKELYVLTKHWKSDLAFFTDEVNFLKNLVGKYTIWLTQQANLDLVNKVYEKIIVSERFKNDLKTSVAKHQSVLKVVAEKKDGYDLSELKDQHSKLEEDMADYVKSFRTLKKEIFKLTSHIIESEKLGNLLQD